VLIESIVFRTRDGRFVGIPHEGSATVDPDKFHQFHTGGRSMIAPDEYTITKDLTGPFAPRFVVRFNLTRIGSSATKKGADQIIAAHKKARSQ
jgi:hypothetical protein